MLEWYVNKGYHSPLVSAVCSYGKTALHRID